MAQLIEDEPDRAIVAAAEYVLGTAASNNPSVQASAIAEANLMGSLLKVSTSKYLPLAGSLMNCLSAVSLVTHAFISPASVCLCKCFFGRSLAISDEDIMLLQNLNFGKSFTDQIYLPLLACSMSKGACFFHILPLSQLADAKNSEKISAMDLKAEREEALQHAAQGTDEASQKALYALSALISSNHEGQHQFYRSKGLTTIQELLALDLSTKQQRKLLNIVTDLTEVEGKVEVRHQGPFCY